MGREYVGRLIELIEEKAAEKKTLKSVEEWARGHNDINHPGSRWDCIDCLLSMVYHGPMPSKAEMRESLREEQKPRERYKPIPHHLRWEVFERDDFTCKSCGSRRALTADHIMPRSKGGLAKLDNLQTLCRSCNSKKGSQVVECPTKS